MQHIVKTIHISNSYITTSATYALVVAALFMFAGISTVQAAGTTYIVDPSGTCGAYCQDLQNYFNGLPSSITPDTNPVGGYVPTGSSLFSAYTPVVNDSKYANYNNGVTPNYSSASQNQANSNGVKQQASTNGYSGYPNYVYNYGTPTNVENNSAGYTGYTGSVGSVANTPSSTSSYSGNYSGAYIPAPMPVYNYYGKGGSGSSTAGGSNYGTTSNSSGSQAAGTIAASKKVSGGTGFVKTSGF